MKKKQVRRASNPGTKDNTSSNSEDEKMKFRTRSSSRKKKISSTSTRDSGAGDSMMDSAYEADFSSRSDTSPPKQQLKVDEYEFDAVEDVPVVSQTRKRKNGSQNKQIKTKRGKKPRANLNMSTSTPVFEGTKSRDEAVGRLVTPEVTPILADDHSIREYFQNHDDNSTPTLRKSLRKRSFSFQDPNLSAISAQLSFDSQGDSGIIITPPLKKIKSSKATASSGGVLQQKSSNVVMDKCSKVTIRNSPVSTVSAKSKKFKKTRNILTPLDCENYLSVKGKTSPEQSRIDTSCFGFDSIQTPSPVCRPKKSRMVKVKAVKDSKKAYRSPKSSSDSIFDESPGAGNDWSSENTDSQENINASPGSPSLFSDVIFSEDGELPSVNKVSNRSYKGFKAKIRKSKPQVSKIDAWASSFNTELENIEKFDLNIE